MQTLCPYDTDGEAAAERNLSYRPLARLLVVESEYARRNFERKLLKSYLIDNEMPLESYIICFFSYTFR